MAKQGQRKMERDLEPFYFGIPLRSAQTSKDWDRVVRQLNLTIASALANGTEKVSVIIACHERPEIDLDTDAPIIFLQSERELPTSPAEQRKDRKSKQRMITEYIVKQGGGYMMILDSDDLLSPDLVSYVREDDNKSGYVIREGYLYYAIRGEFEDLNHFDQKCGSSTVRYLKSTDLDDDDFDWVEFYTETKFLDLYEKSQATSRPCSYVPFPAAVYIRENGENLSQQAGDANAGLLRRILRRLRRRKLKQVSVPTLLIEKFGLQPEAYR